MKVSQARAIEHAFQGVLDIFLIAHFFEQEAPTDRGV
jgi:hypothetical protein